MANTSAEKFKQGMKVLYEDEYDLLHKIDKNAKYENSIDERKLNSQFATNDYTIPTPSINTADRSGQVSIRIKSHLNTNSIMSPREDYGFGKRQSMQP